MKRSIVLTTSLCVILTIGACATNPTTGRREISPSVLSALTSAKAALDFLAPIGADIAIASGADPTLVKLATASYSEAGALASGVIAKASSGEVDEATVKAATDSLVEAVKGLDYSKGAVPVTVAVVTTGLKTMDPVNP